MPFFSPDSLLLAVEGGAGAVRLIEVATGRELVLLEDIQQGRSAQASFSPDGTQLLLTNKDYDVLRIWDLRKLRAGLKVLGLDWDALPYPAENNAQIPAALRRPLEIEIVGAEQLPEPATIAAAFTLNNEAWCLVAGSPEKRDPARALKLIEQAIRDDPTVPTYWNTLGVVQYRNGLYEKAIATLDKSLAAGHGQADAFDLFFQAMCHAKLGDTMRAKNCFDRAVTSWAGKQDLPAQHVNELKTFHTEAQAILGLK